MAMENELFFEDVFCIPYWKWGVAIAMLVYRKVIPKPESLFDQVDAGPWSSVFFWVDFHVSSQLLALAKLTKNCWMKNKTYPTKRLACNIIEPQKCRHIAKGEYYTPEN